MTTTVYTSNDASAPVLSGTVGALINVLDKCLVTGYGAKAGAGWTKPFTGTNLAAFRQPVGTSNGMYLRVDDTVATYASVRGYESMSDVNTGTGQFPLVGQSATLSWFKSNAADATPRTWIVIANERGFYFWNNYTVDLVNYANTKLYYFAELLPLDPSDVWCTVLYADASTSENGTHFSVYSSTYIRNTLVNGVRYAARPFGGAGGPVALNLINYTPFTSGATYGNNTTPASAMVYPNGPDTGLYMGLPYCIEVSSPNCLRGALRGLWAPLHARPLAQGDTFSGTGTLAGRTFVALNLANSSAQTGQVFIETSNTW